MRIKYLMDHPDYLHATTALLFNEWSHLPSWRGLQQIRTRLIERNTTDSKQFTLVALDAQNTVAAAGSLICYELKEDPSRIYWLGEVITRSTHRGQGIGSKVIKRIIELAAIQGITELWLYTPDKQSFYKNLGWIEQEQRVIAGELVTVMVRKLTCQ